MKGMLRVAVAVVLFVAGVGFGVWMAYERAQSWKRTQEARWMAEFDRLANAKQEYFDKYLAGLTDSSELTIKVLDLQAEIARLKGEAP